MCLDLIKVLIVAVKGLISGAVTALLGYAKNAKVEDFDPKKAFQTICVGAFIGAVAGIYGYDYNTAEEWLTSIGAITVFEYVKKTLIRRLKK